MGTSQNSDSENEILEVGCNSKINIKDIYSELFHCRDFELEHLWQRSIFLATFITLILTAYGTFAGSNINNLLDNNFKYYQYYQAICLALCGIGIVFCQLWIAMSKGSKMWYEKYEEAIRWFYFKCDNDTKKKLFDETVFLEKDFTKNMPYFGNLSDLDLNNSFFSTKAGKYSVSRVNTFIGLFLCFVLMVMATLHFSTFFQCEKYVVPLIISSVSIMTYTFVVSKIVKIFVKSRMQI